MQATLRAAGLLPSGSQATGEDTRRDRMSNGVIGAVGVGVTDLLHRPPGPG